jgi:hypothetical protein
MVFRRRESLVASETECGVPFVVISKVTIHIVCRHKSIKMLILIQKKFEREMFRPYYKLCAVRNNFCVIFVNNQHDAQLFFMYVYFYSLHVSGSHVPIIRRINCINTSGICHSVLMTVWCAGSSNGGTNVRCCRYSCLRS